MEHLTVDEITDFISLTELSNDAIVLSATVNGHIRRCEKCLRLVRAFMMVYDEFSCLEKQGDFRSFVAEKISNEKVADLQLAFDEFDGLR